MTVDPMSFGALNKAHFCLHCIHIYTGCAHGAHIWLYTVWRATPCFAKEKKRLYMLILYRHDL